VSSPKKPPAPAPEGIPLAALYSDPKFKRNYDIEFKVALDEDMRRNAARGAKLPPDNRKGDRGALALRITQLMKGNPTVTRTADILALLGPIKGKNGKPLSKETLRKAVNRARR
jgi:hypothetical protein